jgi:hypothetical protein
MRWPAFLAVVVCVPIADHSRELPAPSVARAPSPASADTGEIVYQGLTFRAPAGVWVRQESPQSLVLTRDVSPQRVQRITVFPVPVPEPVRPRTIDQHVSSFFALEREQERPAQELWQGFTRGIRKVGDREFPVLTFTKTQRSAHAVPASGLFALYFPADFAERQTFYCFAWLDLDLERDAPSEDIQPLLSLLATVAPPPARLAEEELARMLALPGPLAASTVTAAARDDEIGRAAQSTRQQTTYSTQLLAKASGQKSAELSWRVDVVSPDRVHVLQSSGGQFDEWISTGAETYRNVGSWMKMHSGEEALNRFFPVEKFLRVLSSGAPSSTSSVVMGSARYLVLEYRTALPSDFTLLSPNAAGLAQIRLWIDPRTHLIVRGDVASRDARGDSLIVRQAFAGYGERIRIEPPVVASGGQPTNPDALSPPGPPSPAMALSGHWEWTGASYGGIGNMLEFRNGAQIVFTYAVTLNGGYRADGDRLIRTRLAGQGAREEAGEDTVHFAVRGDSLLRWWPPRPDTLVASRTPESRSRAGLVGQWSYPYAQLRRPMAGSMPGLESAIAFETFTADGRFHFRIPLRPQPMRYQMRADTLFIEGAPVPGGRTRWQWRISRDTLRITLLDSPGALPALYVRPPPP